MEVSAEGWVDNFWLLSASILASVAESGKITSVHGKDCGKYSAHLSFTFG